MVLNEEAVQNQLGIKESFAGRMNNVDLYKFLDAARIIFQAEKHKEIAGNLKAATDRDTSSHVYFDAVLAGKMRDALTKYRNSSMRRAPSLALAAVTMWFSAWTSPRRCLGRSGRNSKMLSGTSWILASVRATKMMRSPLSPSALWLESS